MLLNTIITLFYQLYTIILFALLKNNRDNFEGLNDLSSH